MLKQLSVRGDTEKNTKVKGVAFNLNNPIEEWMYEEANRLKGKGSYSFSALMKYLFLAYLSKGAIGSIGVQESASPKDDEQAATEESDNDHLPINQDDKGIMKVQFSLDD